MNKQKRKKETKKKLRDEISDTAKYLRQLEDYYCPR